MAVEASCIGLSAGPVMTTVELEGPVAQRPGRDQQPSSSAAQELSCSAAQQPSSSSAQQLSAQQKSSTGCLSSVCQPPGGDPRWPVLPYRWTTSSSGRSGGCVPLQYLGSIFHQTSHGGSLLTIKVSFTTEYYNILYLGKGKKN